jgi:DNA (cytosine-5)-methyltransferase 1
VNELALFAGAGGGILGGKLLGWRTVCAVEWDAYARDVLVARQNDGCLDPFPVWDDVQTFDGRPWRGRVDVVSGGFPCQDISAAGKGAGITGARSGMWSHMARIIGEVQPRFVFVENSPVLTSRGLGTVLGDLAAMGYDAQWGVLGAIDAGAPHKRERIWIVANNQSGGRGEGRERGFNPSDTRKSEQSLQELAHADRGRLHQLDEGKRIVPELNQSSEGKRRDWWATEPDVGRVAHGVASRVDQLRCLGNGQVPAVAALAWRMLNSMMPRDKPEEDK